MVYFFYSIKKREQELSCSHFCLTIGIRLRLPFSLQVIHIGTNPILDLPNLIVIEISLPRNNMTVLQGYRNFFPLPSDMHVGNPLDSVVAVVSMNHVTDSVRCTCHVVFSSLFRLLSQTKISFHLC